MHVLRAFCLMCSQMFLSYRCPYTMYTRWRHRVWIPDRERSFFFKSPASSQKVNLCKFKSLVRFCGKINYHFDWSSRSFFDSRVFSLFFRRMAKEKQANYKQTSFSPARISTEETLEERFFFVSNANSFICLSLSDDEFWKRVFFFFACIVCHPEIARQEINLKKSLNPTRN